jgi:hypothetical protein
MIKSLVGIMHVNNWKKQEKSFVIAMVLMGIFNLSIVLIMLYR